MLMIYLFNKSRKSDNFITFRNEFIEFNNTGPGGGGGILIVSYIRRLGPFFLISIYFWVFGKMNIFGVLKISWIFFLVTTKLTYI